jgi:hypothetical protein
MPNLRVTLTPQSGGDPVELPFQFKYKLPKVDKKLTIKPTCSGAIIQERQNCVNLAGSIIPWSIEVACPTQYKQMYDLITTCDAGGGSEIYTFDGYWGESYEVIFSELDDEDNTGRNFKMSGAFTILCVNTHPDPQNNITP